jgi:signal transduction histidine kinase
LLRQRIKGNDRTIIDRIDRVVEKLESFTQDMAATPMASRLVRSVRLEAAAKTCVAIHFHQDVERFRWETSDAGLTLGDPDRLEQVFLNLYANAFEAGASQVTTSLRRMGKRLRLRIEDDGKGCAPEDVGRIFEPFFTTKSGPARRGLGMFIVQSIVENHGGRIQAKSKNGTRAGAHGLVFTLDFPSIAPLPPEKPEIPFPPDETARASERWLLALPEPI